MRRVVRRCFPGSRRVIVLLMIVALVAASVVPNLVVARSAEPQVIVSPSAQTLPGMFQVVNAGSGDQTDPHVDCNLVSYTNDDFFGSSTVRYLDFSTGIDRAIPFNGQDSLSRVSGNQIVFTEASQIGDQIVVFDTASQTRTVIPGNRRSSPAIGGTLVAFEDRSFSSNWNESEISLYDVSTATLTRLTDDTLFDGNAAVSPNGNAVVWEKCQTSAFDCDVYAAIQTSPSVFTTTALTGAEGEDHQPETNGAIVVYASNRGGETDIYFQPVTGGAETRLSIPGDQRDPSISGNLIAFESQGQPFNPTEYDILAYDISGGKLYRVTNTPTDETLSHISVCNGTGRLVYAAPASDYDVYAFTFQVPSSTANQINDLIALVHNFNLPDGIENSLTTKLRDALAAIDVSDNATACDSLTAFISEVQAQSGKKLTAQQSAQLINSANQIKTSLGCQ